MTQNIYDMADTWNDGATVFTGIKMNVTDTASNASSLLMDLQVGSATKARIKKTGYGYSSSWAFSDNPASDNTGNEISILPSSTTPSINLNNAFDTFITLRREFSGSYRTYMGLSSASVIGFSSTAGSNYAALDLFLQRDAANTLAQRNATNAQAFRIYNTYTDTGNYERGHIRWNANVLEIGTAAAGTGTARGMSIGTSVTSATSVQFLWATTEIGRIVNGASAAASRLEMRAEGFAAVDTAGTSTKIVINQYGARISSDRQLTWSSSTTNPNTPIDTGLSRSAAGVVKVTDGSTGTGQLIFVVPTSDPGITGALWNNGGTLSISA